MSESQRHFREIVWTDIKHWFTDGLSDARLVNTEDGRDALSDEFDWHTGIDFWLFGDEWCHRVSRHGCSQSTSEIRSPSGMRCRPVR